ncbi:hypothetical protein ACIKP9_09450 [Methylobacillus methanolivorans]|uniref:EF-hand domain-containing protein n=1 Tax=Methylobacillus methanolivorans TaxID=1848927 RepID=A0ABW8GMP8_9PROT
MLRCWRQHYVDLLTSVSHLALLLIGIQFGRPDVWQWCLGLVALVSGLAWVANYRRVRAIADLPTSRINSAAQGYVELYGRALTDPEHLIVSPFSALRCVWYRYKVYRKHGHHGWRLEHQGVSHETFIMTDGNGQCFVDPDHAEVMGAERRVTYQADYKRVEEILFGGSIYVLGELTTVGGANTPLNPREDVSALLAEWKQDKANLLQRFDLDGNGEIDLKEWELARRAAAREVEKQHREWRATAGVHVIRAPADGRIFLLSSLSPQRLRQQYQCWSWVHLLILIVAIGAFFWVGEHPW